MSGFIDEQAEVSDNDGTSSAISELSEPVAKKRKVKRRRISSTDEEDEEEDDAAMREELKGFVVDENEAEEEDDGNKSDKTGSEADDLIEDDLIEDDLDLVNENLGKTVGGRVAISDDEDDREMIKKDLFSGDYDDSEFPERPHRQRSRSASMSSHDSYEDDDRFIVDDDEGRPRKHRRFGETVVKNRAELQEAQDIFGFGSEDVLGGMDEIFADLDEEEGDYEGGRRENTLIGVIEPDELEKYDSEERKIVFNDVPERFQTRRIPVTSAEDDELKSEALWIQQNAFETLNQVSKQEGMGFFPLDGEHDAPEKIQEILHFIRNSNFEVPFIAFYRKEHVENIVGMQELWTIFEYDEKWSHFRDRKKRLTDLLNRMSNFINDLQQIDETTRLITEKDFQELHNAQTSEEIMDCFEHFQLYYSNLLTRMIQYEIEKAEDENSEQRPSAVPKLIPRNDKYWNCALNGPGALTSLFGLTAEQVAENFDYIRHTCTSSEQSPEEVAEVCQTNIFPDVESVLDGAVYVMAYRLSREPAVRRKIREVFRNHAKIRVYPTKKGLVTIDDSHPLYPKRYLKGKPVRDLEGTEYLQFQAAKESGLLNLEIYIDDPTEELKINNASVIEDILREDYFRTDETTDLSMKWNELRQKSLTKCVNLLCQYLVKETHELLLVEAKNCVLREARDYFERRISPGRCLPSKGGKKEEGDEEEEAENIEDDNPDAPIIAIALAPESPDEATVVILDQHGLVVDTCSIPLKNRFDHPHTEGQGKAYLRAFIQACASHKPYVIALAALDVRIIDFKRELEMELQVAVEENRIVRKIPIMCVTAEAAKVYSRSRMSERELPNYPSNVRLTISVGRTILDPLVEYAHLCNSDNDFLSIRIHPLQNYVSPQELSWCFQREFINRVNEVGVDINYCIDYPHTEGVLQFVCGLGPRKAAHILQLLKNQEAVLDARSKLVTLCNLGPTIFVNSAGFIRIDVEKLRDTADEYIEKLDGSRVHPETYEWARKMAIDALEFEENNDPSAIDEIIAQPDRLKDLDLDAFAEELNRQGFGNKSITLYDIRAELNTQYKDLREDFGGLNGYELFKELVTNPELFAEGKIVHGRIQRVVIRRDKYKEEDELKQPKSTKDKSGFICPTCKEVFPNFSYVTNNHMGTRDCRGWPSGVNVELDDGVIGFIRRKNLSDDPSIISELLDNMRRGQNLTCRVLEFNQEKCSLELSCKSSDLKKDENVSEEPNFDHGRREKDQQNLISAIDKNTVKTNFTKRVISHQSFHNVTHTDAEKMLSTMSQGEAVIRPSSSSVNNLAVTWKVTDGVYQHVRVEESKKKHAFDLGKELRINNEVFEDLDEILARYITPLAESVREVLNHKYYIKDFYAEGLPEIEDSLRSQKEKQPGRIPYIFTASREYPGKFLLSYLAGKPRHEFFTPNTDGFRFRKIQFSSLDSMLNWFKVHFRDPISSH